MGESLVSREAWSAIENAAIVADYMAMLGAELRGEAYSKAEHNRALRARIDRSRGSIEFKHQNISAVLMGLGEPWIDGYKPAHNYQDALMEEVVRHLGRDGSVLDVLPAAPQETQILSGPPPTLSNAPPPDEAERMAAVARRFDVAARQERNRALGKAGEAVVLAHERAALIAQGRSDLADDARWVSELDGDGAGYDIASFEPSGARRLIEVKTTNGWERTPFYLSRNDLDVAEERSEEWRLVRVWNYARGPRAFEIALPLKRHVSLIATGFRAEFSPSF